MARRRKKNPLLMRIVVISVLAHVIILPILAHYGAFKNIEKQMGVAKVVLVQTNNPEKEKPVEKKKSSPHTETARKGPTSHRAGPSHPNYNAPKVVAVNDGTGGDSGAAGVDANASGKAGVIPTPRNTNPAPEPKPEPKAEVAPVTTPTPVAVTKPEPKPEPKPAPKHIPVFADVQPIDQPQPTIPDDLRTDALDKTFVAEFTVGTDGKPVDVKTAQSTGIKELDNLALDAARKWRFKPATLDGDPTQRVVRVRIEFQVQ